MLPQSLRQSHLLPMLRQRQITRSRITRDISRIIHSAMFTSPDRTRAAKKALRKDISTHLAFLNSEAIASQSTVAQSLILCHPNFKSAQGVGIYLAMPVREAQTSLLVTTALQQGKKVFVPYLHAGQISGADGSLKRGKVMDMLELSSVEEAESLERDAWGIPTLSDESIDARENALGGLGLGGDGEGAGLDLIVVPAVAFDEQMNRLGHGAGFYDRYLTGYCKEGRQKPFLGTS
jgi:5-formyltetrahydrofolate cyclo-ligase